MNPTRETSTEDRVTKHTIAADLIDYLRENSGVCVSGSTPMFAWLRYHEGEWRAVRYGGEHRLSDYVQGRVYDEEQARSWLCSNPMTLTPSTEAGQFTDDDSSVWADADDQDVFEDVDRCFWCGQSEHSEPLEAYETTEQGECLFCEDCLESWERAGEIADGPLEVTA